MDYQRFRSMSTKVPNLYRNSGVLKYGGTRQQERNVVPGGGRRQDLQVRSCLSGTTVNEFKFQMGLFNVIEVMRQVNDNFIAAVVLSQDKKVLILMDQHAIHERIRYENLLKDYTMQDGKHFISMKLDTPIIIDGLSKGHCEWLLENLEVVERCGIKLKSEQMGSLIITSIPNCFNRKNLNQGRMELERAVRKLLTEVTNDLDRHWIPTANIPMVIHLAIATEACHGAVRFGEQLTADQCTKLVKLLMHTKAPNRCAHGRPSVIPLIEFEVRKQYQTPSSRVRSLPLT